MQLAKVICDSISADGIRLTTMEAILHRFVLAEFNTHRQFSRNSASSRAIPVAKRIEMAKAYTAFPLEWGKNQKGMQAEEEIGPEAQKAATKVWQDAANFACVCAQQLTTIHVHKQVINRLLEPFVFTTVLVSATEWENFFVQRCSPLAAPEIRVPAMAMQEAYRASKPVLVEPGGWHLPYINDQERGLYEMSLLREASVARCARVSTLTQAGVRDFDADLNLFARLRNASPPHYSPLEHVATPNIPGSGNFTGWLQFRHCMDFGGRIAR